MKTHRKGATGALLDIYEQLIEDLTKTIHTIPDGALTIITDSQTADENCRSLQTILSHVVHSGYGYATSIHNQYGDIIERPVKTFHDTIKAYEEDLSNVFIYTEKIFQKISDQQLEQPDEALKIKTNWGQRYDIEQLTEHAIVHILRHTRQIEKIKKHIAHLY